MIRVLLDTNFLIYCARQKIHYKEEIDILISQKHEVVVPSLVVEELKNLAETADKFSDRQAADLALKVLGANGISVVDLPGKNADEALIRASGSEGIVATMDLELRKKLGWVIVIEGVKKLALR